MTKEQKNKIKWLSRAIDKERKVKALKTLVLIDKQKAEMVGGCGEKSSCKSSTRLNTAENSMFKILDSTEKYNEALKEYRKIRNEIEEKIETVKNDCYYAVLVNRFLNGLKFEEISELMGYSDRGIYNLYKKAIDFIEIS